MANVVAIQVLNNGPRNLVLKLDVIGGGDGELDENLVEVGAYGCGRVRLDSIQGSMGAIALDLYWDGPTQAKLFTVPGSLDLNFDWSKTGGLQNPKVANYTGDVRMLSRGLDQGASASLQFHFVKQDLIL